MLTAVRDKFRSIDIPVRLATSPREFSRRITTRRASTAFMIDIRTRRGRSRPVEYVLLYCGDKAMVRAIHVDPRCRQVLLDVKEPESRITTVRWDPRQDLRIEEELRFAAARRRLLVGMDESHLFVCPLEKRASSVVEAHRKLAPDAVHRAGRGLKVKRQGEWFFVPVRDVGELAAIAEQVRVGAVVLDAGMTAGGRPHRATELVAVEGQQYARGRIRHPDHRTLKLKGWHRVLRNTEDITVRPTGMTWVD